MAFLSADVKVVPELSHVVTTSHTPNSNAYSHPEFVSWQPA